MKKHGLTDPSEIALAASFKPLPSVLVEGWHNDEVYSKPNVNYTIASNAKIEYCNFSNDSSYVSISNNCVMDNCHFGGTVFLHNTGAIKNGLNLDTTAKLYVYSDIQSGIIIGNKGVVFLQENNSSAIIRSHPDAIVVGGTDNPSFVFGELGGGHVQGKIDFKTGSTFGQWSDVPAIVDAGAVVNLTSGVTMYGVVINYGNLGLYNATFSDVNIKNSGTINGGTDSDHAYITGGTVLSGGILNGVFHFLEGSILKGVTFGTGSQATFKGGIIQGSVIFSATSSIYGNVKNVGVLDFSSGGSGDADVTNQGTIKGGALNTTVWHGRIQNYGPIQGNVQGKISFSSGGSLYGGNVDNGAYLTFEKGSLLTGTVTNNGTLDVSALSRCNAVVKNTGTIKASSTSTVDWTAALSGSGHLQGKFNLLSGSSLTGGTVDANASLTFQKGSSLAGTVTNNGTLDVSADGITIQGKIVNGGSILLGSAYLDASIENSSGAILQAGEASSSYIYSTVSGGHLRGHIDFKGGSNLSGITIDSSADVNLTSGVTAFGTIENYGTFGLYNASLNSAIIENHGVLNGGNDSDHITVSKGNTITGGDLTGIFTFSQGSNLANASFRAGAKATFNNGTISGIITFQKGSSLTGTVMNNGTLDVSALSSCNAVITNTGTIKASSTSTVDWTAALSGSGHLQGKFNLLSGSSLTGGTVDANASLTFQKGSSLAGTVTNNGTLDVSADGITIQGKIVNGGSVLLGSTYLNASIENSSGAILQAGEASSSYIYSTVSGGHLRGHIDFKGGSSLSGITIDSSADVNLTSGVTAFGTIENYGTFGLYNASLNSAIIENHGVLNGGNDSDHITVSKGNTITGGDLTGIFTFSQGSNLANASFRAGAKATFNNGTISGIITFQKGSSLTGTVMNNGTLDVSALSSCNAVITNTGTIKASSTSAINWLGDLSGGIITGKFNVEGNINNLTGKGCDVKMAKSKNITGVVSLDKNSSIDGGTLSAGAKLEITKTTSVSNISFEEGAGLDFVDVNFDEGTSLEVSGNNIFLYDENHTIIWSGTVSDGEQAHYSVENDGNGKTQITYIPCFLAGSMILTESGPKKVENISIGDMVVTFNGNMNLTRKVVWIGRKEIIVDKSLKDDISGYPVRIKKSAFAEDSPCDDLLVTAEHCVFVDNCFVPIRMLVNGDSIFYDKSIKNFTCYHFELEQHCVVSANNLLTESLLRSEGHIFENLITSVKEEKIINECSPPIKINTEAGFVEKIYRRLVERCAGSENQATDTTAISRESCVCLKLPDGRIIHPIKKSVNLYKFKIPGRISKFNILSRSSRPCDIEGVYVDDRRNLGLLMENISIFHSQGFLELKDFFIDQSLNGWNNLEKSRDCRWTTGNAEILLPQDENISDFVLVLHVRDNGTYAPLPRSNATGHLRP
ncbi:Hint domain-containing protein [Asaia siamensis]|uniref:Hint domain-containing protein n=1 Tax=Asaia siamensis TaxID=110479 RepID=UPI002FC296B1